MQAGGQAAWHWSLHHQTTTTMITANMPQLVQQLNSLGYVNVHDTSVKTILHISAAKDMDQVDDLVCDALFVDPTKRVSTADGWDIHLEKRDRAREAAADIRVVPSGKGSMRYILRAYA